MEAVRREYQDLCLIYYTTVLVARIVLACMTVAHILIQNSCKPWRNIFFLPNELKVQVASHVSAVFANL